MKMWRRKRKEETKQLENRIFKQTFVHMNSFIASVK
jgi:hypothetical protein